MIAELIQIMMMSFVPLDPPSLRLIGMTTRGLVY